MISGEEDTVDGKWCGGAGDNRDDHDLELRFCKTAVIVGHRLKTALPLLLHFQFINIVLPIYSGVINNFLFYQIKLSNRKRCHSDIQRKFSAKGKFSL